MTSLYRRKRALDSTDVARGRKCWTIAQTGKPQHVTTTRPAKQTTQKASSRNEVQLRTSLLQPPLSAFKTNDMHAKKGRYSSITSALGSQHISVMDSIHSRPRIRTQTKDKNDGHCCRRGGAPADELPQTDRAPPAAPEPCFPFAVPAATPSRNVCELLPPACLLKACKQSHARCCASGTYLSRCPTSFEVCHPLPDLPQFETRG